MNNKFYKVLVLLIFSVAGRIDAQETMMNEVSYTYLEKLLEVAKTNYPKMKMYHHRLEQAHTAVTKASLSWFNSFTFTYLYSISNNANSGVLTTVNPTFSGGYQFAVTANLGALATTAPSVKMAKQDYEIAQDNLDEYNLNLEAIVKERYFTYVKQSVLLNLRIKGAIDVESSYKLMKYKFEKGEETFDNYNKALTQYTNAVQGKIEAENATLTSKTALEEVLGEKLENIE